MRFYSHTIHKEYLIVASVLGKIDGGGLSAGHVEDSVCLMSQVALSTIISLILTFHHVRSYDVQARVRGLTWLSLAAPHTLHPNHLLIGTFSDEVLRGLSYDQLVCFLLLHHEFL